MLRKIRIILAVASFVCCTLLFLDLSGELHRYVGWIAKMQFLPAFLAVDVIVVVGLIILTLVFGRVYCSVVCPLGILQDVVARIRKAVVRKRHTYSKAKTVLRISVLTVFTVVMAFSGATFIAYLIEPYSIFGRIASTILGTLWRYGHNAIAGIAEGMESYAFSTVELHVDTVTLIVASLSLFVVATMAWVGGRTYCNTICPVGTVLGFLSRFSWLKPVIDKEKCVGCGSCGRKCKASCIDTRNHSIDYSRCVGCMDCIEDCKTGAIRYVHSPGEKKAASVHADGKETLQSPSRRTFLLMSATTAAAAALRAQEKKVDGGLAVIEDRIAPDRTGHIIPPGSRDIRHFAQHCTACQLCVTKCPNNVLTPSTDIMRLMQPEMRYSEGFCRPECTLCGEVCPSGAILPLSREVKSSVQIGHAVWIRKNCVVTTDGVSCGNCARHCPAGAIAMVPSVVGDEDSLKIPVVDTARCIGCGACEYLCPARPFGAIYVEGHKRHCEV